MSVVVRSNSNYSHFICTGSTMSLVSGITFGGLLAYGAYQTSANPQNFIFLFGKVLALLSLKICYEWVGVNVNPCPINYFYAVAHIYHAICTGVSSVLFLLMGYRFYNSGKFMPAGLVTALR